MTRQLIKIAIATSILLLVVSRVASAQTPVHAPNLINPTTSGQSVVNGLSPATTLTITHGGTPASTAYTYCVTGVDAGGGTRSICTSTATGAVTLTSTDKNIITIGAWSTTAPYAAPVGACNVRRTAGSATQGLIGTIASCAAGGVLNDTGLTATTSAVPADTSGKLQVAGDANVVGSLSVGNSVPSGGTQRDIGGKVKETVSITDYGATSGSAIDSALTAALGALTGGGTIEFPCGVWPLTGNITVSHVGVRLRGRGYCTSLRPASDTAGFLITGTLFQISDMEVQVSGATDRTAAILFDVQSQQGKAFNLRVTGQATINNGGIFKFTGPSAGTWNIQDVIVPGGVTWQYFGWTIAPTSTVAGIHYQRIVLYSGVTWGTAALISDGGTDTTTCSECELGPVLVQNTTSGPANINPRWIHLENSSIEASGGTCLTVTAVRDFRYQGYIATCNVGLAVGASAENVDLFDTQVINIAQNAVTIASGSKNVNIHHNTFEDIGVQTTNTYDAISVASSATDFSITDNTFKLFSSSNLPRYYVWMGSSADTYVLARNRFAVAAGTNYILRSTTPTVYHIAGNIPSASIVDQSSNTQQLIANNGTYAVRDTAGTAISVAALAADNTVKIGATTAPTTNGHLILYSAGVEVGRCPPGQGCSFGTAANAGLGVTMFRRIRANWYFGTEGGCGSYTDFVVDGTNNKKVSSATYTFVAADVGGIFEVMSGTGWTAAEYPIESVAAGVATLGSSPAAVSTTGGTATVNRGRPVLVKGGVGVADTFRVCEKDASNNYAWTAP